MGWVKVGACPGELTYPAELGPVSLPQCLPSVSAATLGLALPEHPLWGWEVVGLLLLQRPCPFSLCCRQLLG